MRFRYRVLMACTLGFLLGCLLFVLLHMASLFREPPGFSFYALAWFLGTCVLIWEAGVGVERVLAGRFSWQSRFWTRLVLQICGQIGAGVVVFNLTYVLIKQAENWFLGAADPIGFPHLVSASMLGALLSAVLAAGATGIHIAIRWKEAAVRAQRLEKEKVAARYQALKHQVSPHFLFNNLNTLYALIQESRELAGPFTLHMADTYRYILQNAEREVVPIAEEARMLSAYTFLLEQRHGEGLQCRIHLPEKIHARFLVPLALHSLIENAVKHNVIESARPLIIEAFAEGEDWLVVSNNRQRKAVSNHSNGVGLVNLKARYDLLSDTPMAVIARDDRFEVRLPILRVESL